MYSPNTIQSFRYIFSITKHRVQPLEQYITHLRLLPKDCAYGRAEDEMIRDHLVFGTHSAKVRKRLINEGSQHTLEKATQNFEYSQQQLKTMGPPGTDNSTIPKDINAVTRGRPRGRGRGNIRAHRSTLYSTVAQERNS